MFETRDSSGHGATFFGEDGDGAGGMQTNPMAPTNYRLGKLQAHARHSSVEL